MRVISPALLKHYSSFLLQQPLLSKLNAPQTIVLLNNVLEFGAAVVDGHNNTCSTILKQKWLAFIIQLLSLHSIALLSVKHLVGNLECREHILLPFSLEDFNQIRTNHVFFRNYFFFWIPLFATQFLIHQLVRWTHFHVNVELMSFWARFKSSTCSLICILIYNSLLKGVFGRTTWLEICTCTKF